jgi:hypothetical protein
MSEDKEVLNPISIPGSSFQLEEAAGEVPKLPAQDGPAPIEAPLPKAIREPEPPARPTVVLSHVPRWLYVWVPIVTSLASLGIALWSLVLSTSEPQLQLVMPQWVRIGQGGTQLTRVIIQPSFISTGSDRVDLIQGMKLRVEAIDGGDTRELTWLEVGEWDRSVQNAQPQYRYVSDPSPLLVTPSNPQLPIALFTTDPGWKFKAGTYRLTITAQRTVNAVPLVASTQVTLPPEMIKWFEDNNGQFYWGFPTAR